MKYIYLLCALILITFSLNRKSFVSSDEGVNLQMVKNFSLGGTSLVRPSYDPGGHEDWVKDAFPLVLMTPVFHWIHLGFHKITPFSLLKSSFLLHTLMLLVLLFVFNKYYSKEGNQNISITPLVFSFMPIFYFLEIEHEGR